MPWKTMDVQEQRIKFEAWTGHAVTLEMQAPVGKPTTVIHIINFWPARTRQK